MRPSVSCSASTIRRTSASTSSCVASEIGSAPGNSGWPSCGATVMNPTFSLIPQRSTMPRAIWVTCLMSDVRGFTAFAERLAPTQVVAFLNRYLDIKRRELF